MQREDSEDLRYIERFMPEGADANTRAFYYDLFGRHLKNDDYPDKAPVFNHKILDLFELYKQVQKRGGFKKVNKCRKENDGWGLWNQVDKEFEDTTRNVGRLVRAYEQYLKEYEFDPEAIPLSETKQVPKQRRITEEDIEPQNVTIVASSLNTLIQARLNELISPAEYYDCKVLCISCFAEMEFMYLVRLMNECLASENVKQTWVNRNGAEFMRNAITILNEECEAYNSSLASKQPQQ